MQNINRINALAIQGQFKLHKWINMISVFVPLWIAIHI